MKAIVVGCGRVGSALATRLCLEGHEVCVVDREPKSRRLLPVNFTGEFHTGNGYSRAVLGNAGITHADAFIAVTSGDNSNIVAARTAKEFYRVPIVIARIFDPRRADIYRNLGIPTVASVRWTVGRIYRMLVHRELTPEQTFGNGETLLVRSVLPAWLAGRPVVGLEADGEVRVVEVTRGGRSLVPAGTTLAEPGDLVTFVVASDGLRRLRAVLDKELGT
jgi:trk system potassium uptake protein TrkA